MRIGYALERLQSLFASWVFAAVVLTALGSFEVLAIAMLLIPGGEGALGAFAEEFRTWCFGYDPATGSMQWAYTTMMMAHPFVLGGLVGALWWRPLSEAWRHRRVALLSTTFASLGSAALAVLAMALMSGPASATELPFPAEALRVRHAPPSFELTDQDGRRITLAALQGDVVVITGIYATCGHTCPRIMAQIDGALSALSPAARRDVRVLAITLNPEHDTREVMAQAAERYEVSAPTHHLLSGSPDRIEPLLDRLEIARRKDPHTGVIDHANVFIVIDRSGHVAYRFALGERQEQWLARALAVLAAEPRPPKGA